MPCYSPRFRSGSSDGAFTLIEIIAVLTLTALLATIALPALHGARERSFRARGQVELFLIASALEDFRRLYGDYPQTGDFAEAAADVSVPLDGAQAQARLFNALTGVFAPSGFTDADRINGPALLETGKFSLEKPLSAHFQEAIGSPPRKSEEITCFIDPWGRRYYYFYKSAAHPTSWRAPSYLLFSAGPDGKVRPLTLKRGCSPPVEKTPETTPTTWSQGRSVKVRSEHRQDRSPPFRAGSREGFTLVELLTVIAIIGVLTAIILPAASSARFAVNRTKTRVQFSQWGHAVEAFRQEYGYYPAFASSGKINGDAATAASSLHPFHDTLAAKRRDGSSLPVLSIETGSPPPPEAQNFRRISLIAFTNDEIFPADFGDAEKRELIHDAFDNVDIAVLVDGNQDGKIDRTDYATLPAVFPSDDSTISLRPSTLDFPPEGVRVGCAFYSAPPKAKDASQLILSWK